MAGSRRVLVPGGTGYLGGRLVETLYAAGWQVRVVSRGSRAWPGPAGAAIEVLQCDWRDPVARAQAASGCSALVMLAAANEIEAARDPVAAEQDTAGQCLAWLQTASSAGIERFVYLSTVHVYGAVGAQAIDESTPPKPLHPYAESHLAAEVLVDAADRRGDLKTTIFRLSNAFGAPVDVAVDRWTLLVNDLARQAVETGKLVLRTDGMQARDFIPLHAVCTTLRWALEAQAPGSLYNLGSGQSTSVFEMATRVAGRCEQVLGFAPAILRPTPAANAVPGHYLLDVSALQRDGGAANMDWEAEMDALLRFCRAHFTAS